jgi:hypothetical protein
MGKYGPSGLVQRELDTDFARLQRGFSGQIYGLTVTAKVVA